MMWEGSFDSTESSHINFYLYLNRSTGKVSLTLGLDLFH